jgi:hypothetical protein
MLPSDRHSAFALLTEELLLLPNSSTSESDPSSASRPPCSASSPLSAPRMSSTRPPPLPRRSNGSCVRPLPPTNAEAPALQQVVLLSHPD